MIGRHYASRLNFKKRQSTSQCMTQAGASKTSSACENVQLENASSPCIAAASNIVGRMPTNHSTKLTNRRLLIK